MARANKRWLRALAPAPALLALAASLAQAPTAQAQSGIAFETPAVVDPVHAYGEPDVKLNPVTGHVFVSGPAGTGQQRSVWNGSTDGGHSFRLITVNPPSTASGAVNQPGGGDTDIIFDHTGKQYFSDLYALLCFRMATTTDDGATVNQQVFPGGCAGEPQSDRQWYGLFDPPASVHSTSPYTGPKPLLYFEYNGTTEWTKSTDGLNWTPALAQAQGPTGCLVPPPAPGGCAAAFGPDGYPQVDQVTGRVFQASGSNSTNADPGKSVYDWLLNIGTPDASGNLTFLDSTSSSNLIHIHDGFNDPVDDLFSVLSMDSARNLWAVTGIDGEHPQDPSNPLSTTVVTPAHFQIYVSVASAASGWTQWATPVQVSQAPANVNVFPWLVAGGAGRADAVWYGTSSNLDPNSPSGQVWDVYMNQLVWPTDASGGVLINARPSTQMVKVTPHPMHFDDICLAGTGCIAQQGNRNLADFFQVNVDPTGAAEIVYTDTSNELFEPGFTPTGNQTVDHKGAPVVTLIRQSSGPGLFGHDVSGPPDTPITGIIRASGNAHYEATSTGNSLISGPDVPGMDVEGTYLDLSPSSLTITQYITDLSNPSATLQQVPGTFLQYVTRWVMGNTIYYAGMENTAANSPTFYAGPATSTDLCSVSACEPHLIDYPESPLGHAETGSVSCPPSPSASTPCQLTITVNLADIGNPTQSSLLEEVGSYSFASAEQSQTVANAQGQVDSVPLNLDGICCFNYTASARPFAASSPTPSILPSIGPTPSRAPSPLPSAPPLPNTHGMAGSIWLALLWLLVAPLTVLLWTAGGRRQRR